MSGGGAGANQQNPLVNNVSERMPFNIEIATCSGSRGGPESDAQSGLSSAPTFILLLIKRQIRSRAVLHGKS
jgi:hypothetical protein